MKNEGRWTILVGDRVFVTSRGKRGIVTVRSTDKGYVWVAFDVDAETESVAVADCLPSYVAEDYGLIGAMKERPAEPGPGADITVPKATAQKAERDPNATGLPAWDAAMRAAPAVDGPGSHRAAEVPSLRRGDAMAGPYVPLVETVKDLEVDDVGRAILASLALPPLEGFHQVARVSEPVEGWRPDRGVPRPGLYGGLMLVPPERRSLVARLARWRWGRWLLRWAGHFEAVEDAGRTNEAAVEQRLQSLRDAADAWNDGARAAYALMEARAFEVSAKADHLQERMVAAHALLVRLSDAAGLTDGDKAEIAVLLGAHT